MFALLAEIFSVIAPLVVLAGSGWVWAKRGKPYQVDQISLLVTNFGTPCLVIHSLLVAEIERTMIGTMAFATLVAMAAFMAINAVMLRMMKLSVRDYVSGLTFPNAGNAGLSLSVSPLHNSVPKMRGPGRTPASFASRSSTASYGVLPGLRTVVMPNASQARPCASP